MLEPWEPRHLDDFARMVADPRFMKYISRGRPLTREEADSIADRGAALWKEFGFGPWAAFEKASGLWVGRIGLNLLRDWPGITSGRLDSSWFPSSGAKGWPPRERGVLSRSVLGRQAWTGSSQSHMPLTKHLGGSWRSRV